ncbi:MAG: SDR family oxidoreductase [Gemmatimonadetes bacterium]|nr:SDR family oxidoreductase [Gemmatimonadota bacterium]
MRGGVVVTGASSGIGRETARTLAAHRFEVFGTVRRSADADALRAEGITPILMDVTDGASIAAGRQAVRMALGERPLVGLVNNAGVPAAGPLEFLPLDQLRHVLEVNVIGVVAVTQAFLPDLRRSRGRIVNLSSISGRIAMPFAGPYSASKFALEAISDSLRRELLAAGVGVIVIEPGSVRTPIWDKIQERDLDRYRDTPYAPLLPLVRNQALAGVKHGLPPQAVADAVLEALTVKRPKARMVVVRRKLRFRILRLLPDAVLDRLTQRALWRR